MSFTRRSILAGGAAALVSALPVRAERILPATGPRVVVLGGGWGGLTAAKYIRLLDPGIEVVLIERRTAFHSCPISNWVIGHLRTVDEITHSYAALSERHGIRILHTEVEAVDVDAKAIVTADGVVAGDRLILSPGVAFDYTGIDGWSEAAAKRFPAAWSPGPETVLLRARLAELPAGGRVALTIPPSPYRCPPGPYERISLIAAYLKQHNPGATITVLDANQKIVSKGKIFQAAWDQLYPGIVDYRPDSPLAQVDASTGTVSSDFDDVAADVANVIPSQRASRLLHDAGLVPDGATWAPVDPYGFTSTLASDIHIVGDATDQTTVGKVPKSGFIANSMGKVAARAAVAALTGNEAPPPSLINTCYSLVSPEEGASVGAVYGYDFETGLLQVRPGSSGVSSQRSTTVALQAWDWARAIWQDMLG
jgi:sulfide dehydrogenase [flavocytochrome c] flavoprotein subunit